MEIQFIEKTNGRINRVTGTTIKERLRVCAYCRSRFARNTLDTLKYVRMLREKNIAILFEEENLNTTTGAGELMLTILSAMAQ